VFNTVAKSNTILHLRREIFLSGSSLTQKDIIMTS